MARHTKQEFMVKEGITESILNNWIYDHGLPTIQIGRRTYIDDDDFQEWLVDHKRVYTKVPAPKSVEIAIPKQCRHRGSGILSKLRPAR